MKVIGVTGGVGAGKSTVLEYLKEKYHAKVILADVVGHEVMEPGKDAYDRIVKTFGSGILSEDRKIDRKVLGAVVFSDKDKLMKLNAIVHPEVKREIRRRIAQAETAGETYAVVEAALFLEENYDAFCDETWYIYTNEEQRRARLKESRGYTDDRIDQILSNQKTHEEFLNRCQFMIDNNGAAEDTRRQIDKRMKQ